MYPNEQIFFAHKKLDGLAPLSAYPPPANSTTIQRQEEEDHPHDQQEFIKSGGRGDTHPRQMKSAQNYGFRTQNNVLLDFTDLLSFLLQIFLDTYFCMA